MKNMIEISHGDCNLIEHHKLENKGKYEIYITRYGEYGKHFFKTKKELNKFMKNVYGFTEDMLGELYNTRTIVD